MTILQLLNALLFLVLCGLLASHLAKKKGRNPRLWFFIGFIFGLCGVVVILLMPTPTPKTTFKPAPPPQPPQSTVHLKLWYYLDPAHQPLGPMEFFEFADVWKQKSLSEKTYVWGEGMKEWQRLSDIPDLINELKLSR